MKQTLLTLIILVAILICCEKDNDGFMKFSFLIVGDSINCEYKNYNPDLVFYSLTDSLDIDFDNKMDVSFSRYSVYIDTCEEFLANCPPNVICDCFPTIYTDYNLGFTKGVEIAIDNDSTIYEFMISDTISNKNKWSKTVKYPLYHRDIADPLWTGSQEYFIGYRLSQTVDTIYAWLNIDINNSGFIIKELAIQK